MTDKTRILIVEDEPIVAEDIKVRLELLGYQVAGMARSAENALALAEKERPDLVLMDIMLEGEMDGIQAADIIRKRWHLPVIFLTAYSEDATISSAKLTEPFGYLLKPFQDRELKTTIEIGLYKHRAEEVLWESEEKFKYIFDHSVVGKSLTLPSGEINVNHAFCEMLGYSAQELKDRKWQEITHPDDVELTSNYINSMMSGEKQSVRFIKRYIHKNGSIVWADLSTGLRRDKDGKPLYLITSILDITEQKRMEEALHASEDQFAKAFHSNPGALTITDLNDGRLIEINDSFTNIFGYSREESIGHTTMELGIWITPEDRVWFTNNLKKCGFIRNVELDLRTKNGNIVKILICVELVNIAGKACMLSTFLNITEMKRAEEALRKSEERLNQAVRVSQIGIFDHDHRTDTIYWSPEQRHIYGLGREEPVTLSVFLKHLYPEDSDRIAKAVRRAHDPAGDGSFDVEHRIVDRNGSIHWIRTRSSTQFEGEGSLSHPVRTVGAVVDITEQKQAEEELRKGKEQYHTILQTALDGFWVLDLQGHFIDVNEAYCKIIGYSREELLGMTIRDVELLETESETRQRIQKIIGNGYDFFETRHSRKDGQIVDIEASVNYLPNEAKLFVFVRDITERKQVELEREQFLKFFQLSSDIMVIADPNGCFKKVNPACLQILGYSETELLAKPFVDFVHPDDRQLTLDEMARQIKLGFSLKFENRFLCKDSTVRWLSWSANYKKDEGITYATARDITERKQAEDELLKSKFLLNETQNISKVGGWEYDVITGKMTWTEETYRIYGVTPSDYDPNNINHDIEFYVNGDKVIIEHAFKKAVEMGEAYDLELKFRNAYGNKVWVRTIGIPEYKDGRVIRVHGYLMDITERKRAQDERIQLLEREHEARTEAEAAKKLDRMKSMFIASTSHELRTPLNSVIGFSSLLLEGYSGQLTPEQKEQIEIVHSSGKHLLSLINDIIDISQIEAGNIKVEVCEFNLRQVVDEVVLMLKVSISEKKLDMKVNMQDIEMRSDRRLMFQCIVNLLSNAIKYTEKGSVAISAKVINNNVIITVVDTGIGIKTEDIPRLFGPFVRLQSPLTYKTSGTGLGLYLVKKVAKDFLGGDVEVESEVGKGSTFTLCVPVELERKV